MDSDDKTLAILLVAMLIGVAGMLATPWAIPCAALAIAAIALSPAPKPTKPTTPAGPQAMEGES